MLINELGLVYAVSTVADGNMSFRWSGEREVSENRKRFLSKNWLRLEDCVFVSLNHGVDVVEATGNDKGKTFECDAIVTKEKGVALFMLTADCFPVAVYEKGKKLALVHLGYRGVGSKLIKKVLGDFGFGQGAKVIIGPGVRKESYVFDEVVQESDPEWRPYLEKLKGGGVAVDLVGYIKDQVREMGITDIEDCGIDTVKDANYFSHYRSVRTGEAEGRFATVVMLRSW